MKRSIVLNSLAVLVILVLLASCAPAATPAPQAPTQPPAPPAVVSQPTAQTNAVAPTTAPAPTSAPAKVFKVVWWQNSPWTSVQLPDPSQDMNHQYILEHYGIDLQIKLGPDDNPDAKLSAMIAAGDIPDFFQAYWNISNPLLNQLIDQGLLVPVDLSKYDGIKNALPESSWVYLSRDGKAWGFAPPNDPVHTIGWIRQDWLDKLGLKMPTTPEELAKVAAAFTAQDPDGNGKNDTYGMTDDTNHDRTQCYLAPFGTTLLSASQGSNFAVKDSQAYIPELSANAKAGLQWWKSLVDAKSVDPDWQTNTQELTRKALSQDKVGITCGSFQLLRKSDDTDTIGKLIDASGSKANWVHLPPLTGPAGQYETFAGVPIGNAFFVSKQAQSEPGKYEAVMKFLNDAINVKSDTYRQLIWGVKDVTYKTDAQGMINERTVDDAHAYINHYRLFRTGNSEYFNGSWGKNEPFMVTGMDYARQQPRFDNVTGLVPTNNAKPDFDQYVSEMQMKFITGEESLNNWDKFLNDAMTTYKGQQILDDAAAKLKVLGLVK